MVCLKSSIRGPFSRSSICSCFSSKRTAYPGQVALTERMEQGGNGGQAVCRAGAASAHLLPHLKPCKGCHVSSLCDVWWLCDLVMWEENYKIGWPWAAHLHSEERCSLWGHSGCTLVMWGSVVGGVREKGEGRGRRQGGRELPCHKAPVDVSGFTLTSVTSYFPCSHHSHLPPAAGTAVMSSRQPLRTFLAPTIPQFILPEQTWASLKRTPCHCAATSCQWLTTRLVVQARLGSGHSARSGPPRPCISARLASCASSDAPHRLYMSVNCLNNWHAFSSWSTFWTNK